MSEALQSLAFRTTYRPLQKILPSYLYKQFSDDENLQAFVDSYNMLAQSYLDWFNQTPLAVYTSPAISGALLDWIGAGIYGIARPVLSSSSTTITAGYNSYAYNALWYNGLDYQVSGTASPATDDIYKRILTWHLYRGDGQQFSLFWLKRRVARFFMGVNGADADVLSNPPSVAISGSTYTITTPATDSSAIFAQAIGDGLLALPLQFTFAVVLI